MLLSDQLDPEELLEKVITSTIRLLKGNALTNELCNYFEILLERSNIVDPFSNYTRVRVLIIRIYISGILSCSWL